MQWACWKYVEAAVVFACSRRIHDEVVAPPDWDREMDPHLAEGVGYCLLGGV